MRHALAILVALVLAPVLALAGCGADDEATTSCAACATTEQTFGLTERTIRGAWTKEFVAAGEPYTLVRIDYGDTPQCDPIDEDDCRYSMYCGFVHQGVDHPLEVYWVTGEDVLFDLDDYCDELACTLPGEELAIMEDDAFEDWMYETDPEAEPLVGCLAAFY